MGSITAVEIGADTCSLASTSVHKAELRVHAAETLDPAAFPGIDAFTLALQQARKSLKLPRACRAVVWGLPDGATRKDPVVAPLIEPLTRAGFRVKRVVTPCNALGALARLRTSRTGGAMCWLGVNRNGVAIVVIRPGKLLYSHSFAWDSSVGASGSQARLLQRYSLVAFLAPEVRRAIAAAKQKGTTVDGIVTCGNLPDLRALTMPLIEELDIEVETLDSLEGLVMKPELADRLSEVAPAIRLACAGAFARETRSVDESKRKRVRRTSRFVQVLGAAALLALAAGAYWWFGSPRAVARPSLAKPIVAKAPAKTVPPPPATQPAQATKASPVTTLPATPPATTAPATTPATPPHATTAPATTPATPPPAPPPVIAQPVTPATQAKTAAPAPPPVVHAATPPVTTPPVQNPAVAKPQPAPPAAANTSAAKQPPAPVAVAKPAAATPAATPSPAATKNPAPPPVTKNAPPPVTKNAAPMPATKAAAPVNQPPATKSVPPAAPPSAKNTPAPQVPPALNPPPRPADKPEAASAARGSEKPLPELLKDPVPKVTAILVSADRRLATVGDEGQIIAVGDTVGRRVVVAIDDRTVVLREPSGVQIRVALGGRVVGVERPDRER